MSAESATPKDTFNQAPNEAWGDDITQKDPNTFRIYFQNVNGIQIQQTDRWQHILQTTIETFQSDIVGMCETCLSWNTHYVRTKIKQTIQKTIKTNMNINHSHNTAISQNSFLPGGTLLMTKGNWVGRIASKLKDPEAMGRWTGIQYLLKDDRHLYVLSAYRPCQSPINNILPQSNSTFAQQFFKLRERGIPDPNPREQFITDLLQYIQDLKLREQDMLILMFDANEYIGKEKNGIINLVEKAGLLDLFSFHQGEQCNIATQAKGTKRIDYMLGTHNLLQYINKCGYLPFHEQIISDHRGMYIDISNEIIDNNLIIAAQSQREIGSNNTLTHLQEYKEYILKQFENQNIPQRAQALYEHAATPKQERKRNFLQKLNEIDQQVTGIMMTAEKKFACTVLNRTTKNDEITILNQIVRYYKIVISGAKNNKDFSTRLTDIEDQLPQVWNENFIQAYIDQPLLGQATTKRALKKAREKKLHSMREQVAIETALVAEAESIPVEQLEKQKASIQHTRYTFRSLRARFKKKRSHGVASLIVPINQENEGPTQLKTIHNPIEIEQRIINRNIQHFGQAQGTPFTTFPLSDAFGYEGVTEMAKNLVQGKDMENLLDSVGIGEKRILRALNDGQQETPINIDITLQDFYMGFKKWRENTTTSPSGRHLGYYKALLRTEIFEKSGETVAPISTNRIKNPKGMDILKVLFHIAIAALRAGEPLKRWTTVHSSMIEKEPGRPLINRLRVIHIYESDYNMLLKLLWSRRLTWQAHLDGTLHKDQSGSRPGRRAIDVVVFKEHKYLYSRLTRTTLITMDNDAKACYDRIICNLAMMISQYFGMPENACSMQAKTLKEMEFHLKTAMGVSETTYKHTNENPIHGSGQGSCAFANALVDYQFNFNAMPRQSSARNGDSPN